MSTLSDQKLLSGRSYVIGSGAPVSVPIQLDPAEHEGVMVYGSDQNVYYSDGATWRIPAAAIPISRPAALVPTDALTQTQLRLTRFFSSTGEFQAGATFQVSLTGDFVNDVLFTRTIAGDNVSMYQTIYPDDGLTPGQDFYWRAFYTGSEGSQSDYSLSFQQTYPVLIPTPTPVTREGAIVGAVEVTPYASPAIFGLGYYNTQTEFYSADGATLITTVTHNNGAVTSMPSATLLPEGATYSFRTRYGGRAGPGATVVYSDWSEKRVFFSGGGAMLLEYDLNAAASRTVYLPLGTYDATGMNVTVNWGDGTATQTFTTGGTKTHVYAADAGPIVTVTISGTLKQFGGSVNQQGLRRVDNWGFKLGLTSLREALRNTTATLQYVSGDFPTTVTSLQGLCYGTSSTVDLSNLNLSNITNMSSAFAGMSGTGPLVGNLDTSSVTDMSYMFQDSFDFNQDITRWNVSKVVSFQGMFTTTFQGTTFQYKQYKFNQPIGSWVLNTDPSASIDMSYMFCPNINSAGASAVRHMFNQPLGGWNTSRVTNMAYMFGTSSSYIDYPSVSSFNSDIGTWDTSSVTNMTGMFRQNHVFNQPINSWNVSNVTSMAEMFYCLGFRGSDYVRGSVFNQPLNNWLTSKCTNMSGMFTWAKNFNQDIGAWDVSNVPNMTAMFYYASAFNNGGSPSINNWNVSKVTSMANMFLGTSFNQPIGNWNVSNVVDMSRMFQGSPFNQPIGSWNTSKVTNLSEAFRASAFNQYIGDWDTSKVTTLFATFAENQLFNQDIGNWNVSNVSDFYTLFYSNINFNRDISKWNLRNAGISRMTLMLSNNFSSYHYSKMLVGFANNVYSDDGPFAVTFSASKTYTNTDFSADFPTGRFKNAVEARAYLVGSNAVGVTNAANATANGSYAFVSASATYLNSVTGWYFIQVGGAWQLRNNANSTIDTSVGVQSVPYLATGWSAGLVGAKLERTGAAWSITGDVQG